MPARNTDYIHAIEQSVRLTDSVSDVWFPGNHTLPYDFEPKTTAQLAAVLGTDTMRDFIESEFFQWLLEDEAHVDLDPNTPCSYAIAIPHELPETDLNHYVLAWMTVWS